MSTDTQQVDEQAVGGQATRRRIGFELLDVLSGLPLFATAPLYRFWHVRWGATDEEVRGSMPGDEIIARASGYPSAERVLAEYQHIEVGDWAFPMNGLFGMRFPVDETTAFKVKAFETTQWLLWEKPDCTWSWVLRPLPGGRTRLISRQRVHYREPFSMLLMEFGDPPMMRRVLKGIKARAERVVISL
jgi:hypothetical protein